jgi:hypothetical protein
MVLGKILAPKGDKVSGEGKAIKRRALWAALLTKYYLGDDIKKNEMGGAWDICGEEERCIQGFGGETWG